MRYIFRASRELYDQLKFLQKTHRSSRKVSKKEVLVDAIEMLYQINLMLENGYRFAIIDPKGKKHYLNKRKDNKDETGPSKGKD